jgi:outer membrane protein OmpA-like peptidoglycan-associated protein
VALPLAAGAQSLQYPGFYVGAAGGLNWLFSNSYAANVNTLGILTTPNASASFNTGWAVGGMVGYDFVGPRVELEGMYRDNTGSIAVTGVPNAFSLDFNQISVMANLLYDFNAGGTIVPYVGAGAGVAFINSNLAGNVASSTQFAYQAMLGVGYNIDPQFRVNLEGRYYGTTSPAFNNSGSLSGIPFTAGSSPQNNNVSLMVSLQVRFGAPASPPPPVTDGPGMVRSFMVFFDWDSATLSDQALSTIKQAAAQSRTLRSTRITATGHTDKSGPESYNMALSLRRANAVKNALVREGVPAAEIAVIGRGESQPLVPTADGVREPQNRRVEIVI